LSKLAARDVPDFQVVGGYLPGSCSCKGPSAGTLLRLSIVTFALAAKSTTTESQLWTF